MLLRERATRSRGTEVRHNTLLLKWLMRSRVNAGNCYSRAMQVAFWHCSYLCTHWEKRFVELHSVCNGQFVCLCASFEFLNFLFKVCGLTFRLLKSTFSTSCNTVSHMCLDFTWSTVQTSILTWMCTSFFYCLVCEWQILRQQEGSS